MTDKVKQAKAKHSPETVYDSEIAFLIFAELIASKMESQGLTYLDFANKIGRTVDYVERLFTVGGLITFAEVCEMARAVGFVFAPFLCASTDEMLRAHRHDLTQPMSSPAEALPSHIEPNQTEAIPSLIQPGDDKSIPDLTRLI